jgi:hypothetical protein
MNYISLNDFKWGWIFRHRELPVDSESLTLIRPLDKVSANQFWRTHLSKEATHASHFLSDDWPEGNGIWGNRLPWQAAWDSDLCDLPEELASHCRWEANVTVYFAWNVDHVIETRWDVFERYWKNFLFYDDEPFLLGKGRRQIVRFHTDGTYQTGIKPVGK